MPPPLLPSSDAAGFLTPPGCAQILSRYRTWLNDKVPRYVLPSSGSSVNLAADGDRDRGGRVSLASLRRTSGFRTLMSRLCALILVLAESADASTEYAGEPRG